MVHSQQGHACAANWRSSNDASAVATKVSRPIIETWVEEPHDLAPARLQPSEVGSFGKIAIGTRQGEVFRRFPAAMLSRLNVLDMETQF
jgi:hypothetical protein